MRIAVWTLGLTLLASPASAGCITDTKAAELAAKLFAASRVCPAMRSASDDTATDLAVTVGAVDLSESSDPFCRVLVEVQSSKEWGRLVGMPPGDQGYVCREIGRMIEGHAPLREALGTLGLLR